MNGDCNIIFIWEESLQNISIYFLYQEKNILHRDGGNNNKRKSRSFKKFQKSILSCGRSVELKKKTRARINTW